MTKKVGITRRQAFAAAAAPLVLPGLVQSALAQGAKKPFVFLTWGGGFGKAVRTVFSDPFQAAAGLEVVDITPFNYGRFVTAMQNKNPEGFDLVWFTDEVEPARAGAEGLLEPLNYDLIPNAAKAIPTARQPFAASPYVTVYQVGYRTDLWKTPPQSFADFWNVEKFPGPRSLGSWVGGVLEAALLADGVSPQNLYPLDEERAYRSLAKIKPHIRVFHNTSAAQQVRQMLYQGEVSMVLTWSTDFIAAHQKGQPIDVIWNQGFFFSPSVGIPKGSAHVKEAHAYINQFFDENRLLEFVKAWPTTPSVPAVQDRMTAEQKGFSASGHLNEMINLSRDYYRDNQVRLQQRYDTWRVV